MTINSIRKILWSTGILLMAFATIAGFAKLVTFEHVQALLVWLLAGVMLIDSLLRDRQNNQTDYKWFFPVGVLCYGLLSSVLLAADWSLVFFGFLNQWLGAWTLACCIIVGLLAHNYITQRFIKIYYWVIVGISLVSVLKDLPRLVANERLAGLVLQPDILAVILGTGLIVSLFAPVAPKKGYWRGAGDVILLVGMLLTRTRAVIYLLPIWLIYVIIQHRNQILSIGKKQLVALVIASLAIGMAGLYAAPRVLSLSRAQYGVSYRLDLIRHSGNYLQIMPFWGLGPAGLPNVVADYYPLPSSLERTIVIDQKIPENSHNIFLDRFLEYGWLAGLAYIATVVMFIIAAVRTRNDDVAKILSVMGIYLLIQQSVTSTNIILELLTWVCLLGVISKAAIEAKRLSVPKKVFITLALVYLAIMGLMLQIRLDQKNALKRVANNFVFPLVTSKEAIWRGTSYNGEKLIWDSMIPRSYHHHYIAADIHVPEGTVVVAAKAGLVVDVRNNDECDVRHFPGVTILGADGFYYYYAHLKPGSIVVKNGDQLSGGDAFAQVGSSACAQNTAAHLHIDVSRFPLALRRGFGAEITRVDPQPALIKAYQELPEK